MHVDSIFSNLELLHLYKICYNTYPTVHNRRAYALKGKFYFLGHVVALNTQSTCFVLLFVFFTFGMEV